MGKYLLRQIMKFRADSENEANKLVSHFKQKHDVTTHRIVRKDKKDETYFVVEIVISENSEKEPDNAYILQ